MSCLIVFRSLTQAQYAVSLLRNKQIYVVIVRPPLEVGKGSCSAALQISENDLFRAASLLNKLSFQPVGYYKRASNGTFQEAFL